MSDDKDKNDSHKNNASNKSNENNETDQNERNEPGASNPSVIQLYRNTDGSMESVQMTADMDTAESDILKFFAGYGKTDGALFPHIPTTEAFVYMKIPPDGGYAWIILLISYIDSMVIDGIMFTVGRVLPYLMDDLKITSSTAALIISIQIGLYYAVGPIASILVNKLGFRYVAIMGVAMAICGNIFASFSSNSIFLFIFFGIMVGFGFGMAILSVQMIVNFYFSKYRALACGVYSSAAGVGVLIFSPINNYMCKNAGWRNAIRLQAALGIFVILISAFLYQVKLTKIGKYVEQPSKEDETIESLNSIEIAYDRYSKFLSIHSPEETASVEQSMHQITKSPAPNTQPTKFDRLKKCLSKYFCCTRTRKRAETERQSRSEVKKMPVVGSSVPQKIIIDVEPLNREDIFYSGNPNYEDTANKLDDENITVLPGKEKQALSINYNISVMRNLATTPQETATPKKIFPHCTLSAKVMHGLYLLFDPKLLNSPAFQVILTTTFFNFLGSNIPYVYLTHHTTIPIQYANILLSTIGIWNTVVRIAAGIIGLTCTINPLYFSGVPMAISGIFTVIIGYVGKDIIWLQFVYCFVFSSGSAFCVTYRSEIMVQLLGLEKLTNAYGINSLGMGVAAFIGTSIAGVITSEAGSTDHAFAFSGITLTLSGLIFVFLHDLIKLLSSGETSDDYTRKVRFSSAKI